MKKIFKQTLQAVLGLAMASLLFSCGGTKENVVEYLAVQMEEGNDWSIIDADGDEVVKEEYSKDSRISTVYDGVYWVKSGDKWELYSIDNPKKAIGEEYEEATDFHAGRAVVAAKGKPIKIIDTSGKVVKDLGKKVKVCCAFTEEGYAAFMNSDKNWGVLDKDGNTVIKAEYKNIYLYISDGVVLAQKKENDEKFLILNTTGKQLGKIDRNKYELGTGYSEGKIVVTTKGESPKQVVLDKNGNKLFTIKKSKGLSWSTPKYMEGYVTFRNDDKYGVVDDKGDEVIRAKYDNIINLGNGEFAVEKNDKWGVVNVKDEEIIPFDYDFAASIKLGDNYIMQEGKEFVVLEKGNSKPVATFYNASVEADSYVEYQSKDEYDEDYGYTSSIFASDLVEPNDTDYVVDYYYDEIAAPAAPAVEEYYDYDYDY